MSDKQRYTPGPWNVATGLTDETAVCSVWPVPSWRPVQVKAQCLVDSDAAEANARLIAAAPELYEACDAVNRCGRNANADGDVTIPSEVWDLIAQALSRARGES